MRPFTAALALLGVVAFALILSLTATVQGDTIETQESMTQAPYTAVAGTPEVVPVFFLPVVAEPKVHLIAQTAIRQKAKPTQKPVQTVAHTTSAACKDGACKANRQRRSVLKTVRAVARTPRAARRAVRIGIVGAGKLLRGLFCRRC